MCVQPTFTTQTHTHTHDKPSSNGGDVHYQTVPRYGLPEKLNVASLTTSTQFTYDNDVHDCSSFDGLNRT